MQNDFLLNFMTFLLAQFSGFSGSLSGSSPILELCIHVPSAPQGNVFQTKPEDPFLLIRKPSGRESSTRWKVDVTTAEGVTAMEKKVAKLDKCCSRWTLLLIKGKAIRSRTPGCKSLPTSLLITVFPCCEGLFVEEMELVDVTSISWGEHGVTRHLNPFALSISSSLGKGCRLEDEIYLQIN